MLVSSLRLAGSGLSLGEKFLDAGGLDVGIAVVVEVVKLSGAGGHRAEVLQTDPGVRILGRFCLPAVDLVVEVVEGARAG